MVSQSLTYLGPNRVDCFSPRHRKTKWWSWGVQLLAKTLWLITEVKPEAMTKALPVKPPKWKLLSVHPFGVQTVHFNLCRELHWRTQAPIPGHAILCICIHSLGPTNHSPLYWGSGLRSYSGVFVEMSLKTFSPLTTQNFLALFPLLPCSPGVCKMPETSYLGVSSAVREFPHLC